MRIDSCRKCGGSMEINKNCNICNKAKEFFCHNCGYATEEQIHSECRLIENNCRMQEIPIQNTK